MRRTITKRMEDLRMIKEWLLARILKNKIVFFEEDNEYKLINDIEFDGDVIVCRYYNFVELEE